MQTPPPHPRREVMVGDALTWLKDHPSHPGASFITSLPDHSEIARLSLSEWQAWFIDAAALVLNSTPDDGVAIFFQTDIKVDGTWIDKAFLCQLAAQKTEHALLWHKLACKAAPGNTTYARPGYSHLICFSKTIRAEIQKSSPDVLPETGDVTWAKGMGVEACREACRFILSHTQTRTVIDPFCGHGTALAVANSLGLDAIGVELGGSRADKARRLTVLPDGSLEFQAE